MLSMPARDGDGGGRRVTLSVARLSPLGDGAIVITVGEDIGTDAHESVMAVTHLLDVSAPRAMVEYVPAFTTVTVIYDPLVTTYDDFARILRKLLGDASASGVAPETRVVEIPVCYGDDFGPDLGVVTDHSGLTVDEVMAVHTDPDYLVHMIGFAPGFPYLGGVSERIAVPRRDSPRDRIPAGSVGIAGVQTGVYPIETPGGWQLIGRTPLQLFRPGEVEPSLLRAGDRVRFQAIGRDEYDALLERDERS